jgi:hypothetical protein
MTTEAQRLRAGGEKETDNIELRSEEGTGEKNKC